jgi:AraC-like DNA-binding protein
MSDVLSFVMEELFARSKVEFRIYTGVDVAFKRLDLAYPAPPCAQRYHEVFGCRVRFDHDRNRLVMDADYLDQPIALSNPEGYRLCEEQCAKLLGALSESSSVCYEVRRRLILGPGRYPSLSDMSADMGLSATVLRRRLRESGETYQRNLDAVRKDLAVQYLTETRLTPKEIGHRPGFSNVHNFSRAFKSWTGHNPSFIKAQGSTPKGRSPDCRCTARSIRYVSK